MDGLSTPEVLINLFLKYSLFPAFSSPLSSFPVSELPDIMPQIEEDMEEDINKRGIDGEGVINDKIEDITACGRKIDRQYYYIRRKL